MTSGYVIPVNPQELASRIQYHPRFDEDEEEGLDPEEAEINNVSLDTFASYFPDGDFATHIAPLLDRIPEREADFIELFFIRKKIQADIAHIFDVTQAAVSYRLARGVKRLKFLLTIPQITEEEMRADLPKVFPTKLGCPVCAKHAGPCPICHGARIILLDVEILVGLWEITCQSRVADKLGLTQGRVRHRFFRAVDTLASAAVADERYQPYHKFFQCLSETKKFNILHEVKLPQWADRGCDECA